MYIEVKKKRKNKTLYENDNIKMIKQKRINKKIHFNNIFFDLYIFVFFLKYNIIKSLHYKSNVIILFSLMFVYIVKYFKT